MDFSGFKLELVDKMHLLILNLPLSSYKSCILRFGNMFPAMLLSPRTDRNPDVRYRGFHGESSVKFEMIHSTWCEIFSPIRRLNPD